MTLQLTGGALYGYHPGNTSDSRGEADYILPPSDFILDISERGQELKDEGSITVSNFQGQYTGVIGHGDRVEFYIEGPNVTTSDSERYGDTRYGEATVSEGLAHRWTGIVRPWKNNSEGGDDYSLELTVEDFVYAVLGSRPFYRNFTDTDLGEVMRTAINAEAPEIDTSEIQDVGVTTDLQWNGRSLLELLQTCLSRGNAVSAARGRKLIFRPTGAVDPSLETSPEERDYRSASLDSNDDTLINQVRIAGGTDIDLEDDTPQSAYGTVTEDSRLTAQVSTRKSRLAEVEIWTRPTGTEEDITVRLQKDDGGQPVAINDSKSDIVKKSLSQEFLDTDGWTTFILPEHTLPESNPWLIVQSGGTDGQDIGTDGSGNLAYRAHFPFPVNVEVGDPQSQSDYRLRGDRLTDESLNTFSAARDEATATLRHRKEPRKTVSFECMSPAAHNLQVGDVVTLEDKGLGASGDWVVTQRDQLYSDTTIQTSVTAHEIESL